MLESRPRLRAGFRALAFMAALYAVVLPLLLVLPELRSLREQASLAFRPILIGFVTAIMLLCVALVSWVFVRFVEKQSFSSLGLVLTTSGDRRVARRDVIHGVAVATLMMSVAPLVLLAAGRSTMTVAGFNSPSLWLGLLLYAGVTLLIALNEELLFRGYLLQRLIDAVGVHGAVIGVSALFGFGHYLNPQGTVLGALGAGLWGLIFSYAYVRTGSLFFSIGLHWAANWVEGSFWGLAVSGHVFEPSLIRTTLEGPEILTGGIFGPEASLFTVATIALGILYVMRRLGHGATVEETRQDGRPK